MKTLEINGVTFELTREGDLVDLHKRYLDMLLSDTRLLSDCYTKPSDRKQAIYKSWVKWFRDTKQKGLFTEFHNAGVCSYTCMMFTLHGCFEYNGICYIYYITPSHNYLTKCSC